MSEGNLVRCLDSGRVGVILDKTHTRFTTMVLVRWGDQEAWSDVSDLEVIDSEGGHSKWTSF